MKILVRGTNWIGDAVMSIPALRELSRVFPDDPITLYTRPWAEGVFADVDFLNEILTFDPISNPFKNTLDEVSLIKSERFDLAILFTNSFETALIARLAGIPRTFGFNKDLRGLLLTDPIPVPEWKGRTHEAYYYLQLIKEVEQRVLGTRTVGNFPLNSELTVANGRKEKALAFLASKGADISIPTVAIGAGSTNSLAKRWPVERFAELAERLGDQVNVVLLGAKDERPVSIDLTRLTSRKVIDLTGETELSDAVALLSIVDLFIANDMGLAHVAAAVGTETLVIFGPTNEITTRPFSENAEVIRHDVECSPCMLRKCPIDHRCMIGVSVDKVLTAATLRLGNKSSIISLDA